MTVKKPCVLERSWNPAERDEPVVEQERDVAGMSPKLKLRWNNEWTEVEHIIGQGSGSGMVAQE